EVLPEPERPDTTKILKLSLCDCVCSLFDLDCSLSLVVLMIRHPYTLRLATLALMTAMLPSLADCLTSVHGPTMRQPKSPNLADFQRKLSIFHLSQKHQAAPF